MREKDERTELLNIRAKKIISALDGLSIRECEFILDSVRENLRYCSRVDSKKSRLNLVHQEIP